MRHKITRRFLVACAVALASLAQPVQADEAERPVTTDESQPSDASTTAATDTAAPATAAEDQNMRRAEFERVSKQYRKLEKDGQTLYCRNEKQLGTRLGKPVCLTDAQLWERIRKAEDVRNEMRSAKPGPCQPPMTCN